jgi:chromosome segregation ATPase
MSTNNPAEKSKPEDADKRLETGIVPAEQVEQQEPTLKDFVMRAQDSAAKEQAEALLLQQQVDTLTSIQAELAAGQSPSPEHKAMLTQVKLDPTILDKPAEIGAQIDVLAVRLQSANDEVARQNTRVENLRKRLTPEDELSMAFDRAKTLFSKEKVTMVDIIQAIAMVIAALQKYFKHLSGQLDKAMGKTPEGAPNSPGSTPGITGTPAEHTRKLITEAKVENAAKLKEKKEGERDQLVAKIPTIEAGRNTAKGKLATAEENLKSLRSKSDAKPDDLRTAQTAVETAQAEVDKLNKDLAEAQKKLDQTKADITAIESAVASFDQHQARLKDVIAKAVAQLPAGELSTALNALDVQRAANGIDIALAFKAGTDMPKLLAAFKSAGITNLDTLGINAATKEVTNPTQFIEALMKVAARAALTKPTV